MIRRRQTCVGGIETASKGDATSFRDSFSSAADGSQTFRPGDKVFAVDTSLLPQGSVDPDGFPEGLEPAGHVSVRATPDEIRRAVTPKPLADHGMRGPNEDNSYTMPK
jgi:hypothetical protein